ncbi:inositol monophosphatase family protein [Novipirellula sp.]|uniref:inositol monophosphatase family protein n=1 Tax=Novipirellula sp. TaxID=2795430 RepID=UPI00356AFF7C
MNGDLDVSLAIRIIRDVYNRCGFSSLSGVYAEKKGDSSPVTDIDPLVEHIILGHLEATSIGDKFACVREEATGDLDTIEKIKEKEYLATIDGIDGTGDFIRHFNRNERNPKWLVGLTAIYKKDGDGLYVPIFAFALQPFENRLFVMCHEGDQDKAYLIKQPLGLTQIFELNADNIANGPDIGSIDVFLDKPDCQWQLNDQSLKGQTGPSGFNTASLAAAAAPFHAFAGSDKLTFTTFHYKLWDFGLWPVLQAAGIKTLLKEPDGIKLVNKLNLNWFGQDDNTPGKCDKTPIILSKKGHVFDPLEGKP